MTPNKLVNTSGRRQYPSILLDRQIVKVEEKCRDPDAGSVDCWESSETGGDMREKIQCRAEQPITARP
jgi:hypothetical protein